MSAESDDSRPFDLRTAFAAKSKRLRAVMEAAPELVGHMPTIGDGSEAEWITMLREFLPRRYAVDKAFVVDSCGPIVHAGGTVNNPKPPPRILGGLLACRSDWNPPFGQALRRGLDNLNEDQRIDLGSGLEHGAASQRERTGHRRYSAS